MYMKKILLPILTVFSIHSFSQTIDNQVVGSAGGSFEAANGSLSSTMGETVTNTLEQTNVTLTQGFQQPTFFITSVDNPKKEKLEVEIFPNPTTDVVYLKTSEKSMKYHVLDLSGKILETGELIESQTKINLLNYAKNIYLIEVYSTSKNTKNTFKVTKQ